MKTRLLTLHCEQPPKGKLQYFITQQAEIRQTGGSFGKGHPVRISRRTANVLMGWFSGELIGTQKHLASVTVAIS